MNKNKMKQHLLNNGDFLFEVNEVLSSYCNTKYDFMENTGKQNLIEVYGFHEEQFVNYDRSENWLLIDNNLIVSYSKEEAISMLKENINDIVDLLTDCINQNVIIFDLKDCIIY